MLTPHFTLEEMIFSQTAARKNIDNTPTPAVIENLTRLCNELEKVRTLVGKPIKISSGYRSPNLNRAIGGANSSQHTYGCAADFIILGMSLDEAMKAIIESGIGFDQLIKEYDSWIHMSVPNFPWNTPRKEILIIDKNGTRKWH